MTIDHDSFPTFYGEKNKSLAREMLGAVDRSSIQTKVIKSKNPDGTDKETRLRTRAGENEFVTTEAGKDIEPAGPVGGFVLSPNDGNEDPISPQELHNWDKVFFKTADYEPPARIEKLPLLKKLKKNQNNQKNKIRLHTKRKSAHVSWTGSVVYPSGKKMECVVSWDHGIKSRYRLHRDQDCSGRIIRFLDETPEYAQSGKPNIYINGEEIETKYIPSGSSSELEMNVVGAAVFDDRVVFMSHYDLSYAPDDSHTESERTIAEALAHSTTVTVFYLDGAEWKVAGAHHADSALKAPWFFKNDGSRASAVRETSATNQWMMHIDLAVDELGVITSSFSEIAISESTPFFVETTLPYARTESPGATGWQPAGDWIAEEYGHLTLGYTIDWRAGNSVSSTISVANNMKSYADGLGINGTPYAIEAYRVTAGEAAHAVATANNAIGTFSTQEIYTMINTYGNVRGQVDYRARRDTENISENNTVIDTFPRYVGGKRTIAVDYGFDGEFLVVTEELKSIGTAYSTTLSQRFSNQYKRPDYFTVEEHDVLNDTNAFATSGNVEWQVKINDVNLLSISGGVNDGGVCTSSFTRNRDVLDGVESESITSYTIPSSPLHVERGWIIDLDARSSSCIYEKIRQKFEPMPTVAETISQFVSVFHHRIMTQESSEASINIIHNGIEISETIDLGTKADQTLLRPYALMMQLVPRLHDLSELLEEESLLQTIEWSDGSATLDATRYFYIPLDGGFDAMPRGGIDGDKEGQLQSRNIDQTVFSTASRTTAQIQNGPLAEIPTTKVHDVTYSTRAFIRGDEYPLIGNLSDKLGDETGREDSATPRDSLRINPVFAT